MPDLANQQEYLKRFHTNMKITGWGASVKTHFPCPFCAAPEWMVQPITDGIDGYPVFQAVHRCGECGRSAKNILERENGGLKFEVVQVDGPDQPEWFQPKLRRI